MALPRQVVDPPSFTPSPFGLLTAMEMPTAPDHWQQGISYEATCSPSLGGLIYDECIAVTGVGGAPPPPPDIAANVSQVLRGATSFTTFVEFDCSTVGLQNAQATAERALASAEPWQVERAFWTGFVGSRMVVFPHLAAFATVVDADGALLQSAATVVTGVSGDLLNVATALGLLEEAIGNCYGGVGVIHVPAVLAPTLSAYNLITAVGQTVMRTANGNKVAIGSGYPGTSPSGAARTGNSAWMFATGNVFGYRSEVRVRAPDTSAASLDRATNTRKMIAERTYVVGWDCCHFAVNAALGVPKGT